MPAKTKIYLINFLLLILVLFFNSPTVFAQEAASFPPNENGYPMGNGTSAQFYEGWNFFKAGVDGCSVKNILDELQAAGGSALNVANLFIKEQDWQPYSFATANIADKKISDGELLAFNSNQKFFLELNQKNCTNPNSERLSQIEQVRDGGATKVSLASRISELPVDLWTKLIGLLNKTPESAAKQNFENMSLKGKTVVADLGITGLISQGLLSINGLSDTLGVATINTLSGDLYFQNEQLGGANFLNGKVTIDKSGNLKVSSDITAETVSAKTIRTDNIIINGSDQLTWVKVLNDRISVDKDGNLKITAPLILNGKGSVLAGATGSGAIPKGEFTVDINTDAVTDNSMVFVTSRSGRANTYLSVIFIQKGKFTVSLLTGAPAPDRDVSFDYLIINK